MTFIGDVVFFFFKKFMSQIFSNKNIFVKMKKILDFKIFTSGNCVCCIVREEVDYFYPFNVVSDFEGESW